MTNEEAKRRMEICRNFLANNYSDMGEPNFMAFNMAIKALDLQLYESCIRELIREFDNKHPALFADYMREFNNHPISEIIEYMWDMHNLIEDIKYRLPNKGGEEE